MKNIVDVGFGFATKELLDSHRKPHLPVEITPFENPSIPDRVCRMMIAALVNSGTDVKDALRLVVGA